MATPSDIGGYEYKFVDTPHDRFVCKICIHPSRNPFLSVCCGHIFCKSCLDGAKKNSANCPICRDEKFVNVPNKQADREIRSLHIKCTNEEKGCQWKGELNEINNHHNSCQFEDVKCSNQCGKMLQRRHLNSHIQTDCTCRKIKCRYCKIAGKQLFIEGEHKEQCSKLPLPCPNKCNLGSVPREDMKAHRKECPLEVVHCEYRNVGCEEKMTRKDMEKHEEEKTKEHLFLTKCKLADTIQKVEDTQNKLIVSQQKEETAQEQLTLFQSALADTSLKLDNALRQISALTVLMHQNAVTQGRTSYISGAESVTSVAQWWTELTAKAAMYKSENQVCPVVFNVTEFNEKKENKIKWHSAPFYSEEMEYKMCLRVYPAGCGTGKGTHLSVFLCLMKGPHDDKLTWPLEGNFTLNLLNQISDCEHHSMTVVYHKYFTSDKYGGRVTDGDRALGWGKAEFISNEDFCKITSTCQYLKDDCIFLQVSKQ